MLGPVFAKASVYAPEGLRRDKTPRSTGGATLGAHTPRRNAAGLPHRRLTAVRPAGSHIRGWLIALTARSAGALTGPSGAFS